MSLFYVHFTIQLKLYVVDNILETLLKHTLVQPWHKCHLTNPLNNELNILTFI